MHVIRRYARFAFTSVLGGHARCLDFELMFHSLSPDAGIVIVLGGSHSLPAVGGENASLPCSDCRCPGYDCAHQRLQEASSRSHYPADDRWTSVHLRRSVVGRPASIARFRSRHHDPRQLIHDCGPPPESHILQIMSVCRLGFPCAAKKNDVGVSRLICLPTRVS
jgi:hypothetical protein